ncbi:MAG: hypothetical protein AAGG51_23785 [Cyanobacteria bacterium P01_G01_bin.54]
MRKDQQEMDIKFPHAAKSEDSASSGDCIDAIAMHPSWSREKSVKVCRSNIECFYFFFYGREKLLCKDASKGTALAVSLVAKTALGAFFLSRMWREQTSIVTDLVVLWGLAIASKTCYFLT